MSDKERQKKDGRNKNKKKQEMREAESDPKLKAEVSRQNKKQARPKGGKQ